MLREAGLAELVSRERVPTIMLLFLILGNIAMILALNRAVAIETDPKLAKKG